jgi:TRAP-type C4-dicarboxylate transport system permease large subunit
VTLDRMRQTDAAQGTHREIPSRRTALREMAPYYLPLGITLLLITYVPQIATWIPRIALRP